MRKFMKLFGFLLILSFLSCSSDDENSAYEIVKKPFSLTVETSEGYTWEYRFFYSGNLITKQTYNGHVTEFKYDSNNRLLYMQGSGGKTSYTYLNGQLSSIQYTGPRDYTRNTVFYYNNSNQINKSFNYENNEYEYNTLFYKYDAVGRLIETIYESGNSVKYEYDNANNPFKIIYPQINEHHVFPWIVLSINNVIVKDHLTYEYIYDSDYYPVLIKEIESDGTVNKTTTIIYE